VWRAWTDPGIILKWFGSDPKGAGLQASLDVRPGGLFDITFSNSDRTVYSCFGVYAEVEQHRRLSFTWTWKNEPETESFVTVLFTTYEHLTKLDFEHAHLGTSSKHNYLLGWQATFAKLERVMST